MGLFLVSSSQLLSDGVSSATTRSRRATTRWQSSIGRLLSQTRGPKQSLLTPHLAGPREYLIRSLKRTSFVEQEEGRAGDRKKEMARLLAAAAAVESSCRWFFSSSSSSFRSFCLLKWASWPKKAAEHKQASKSEGLCGDGRQANCQQATKQ